MAKGRVPCDAHPSSEGTPSGRCRECNREYQRKWYAANQTKQRERVRANWLRAKKANRVFVIKYLLEHPCVDCGESDPLVLHFDHLRDKRANITQLIQNASTKTIESEIEKCEVRCANCHLRRTAHQLAWYKPDLIKQLRSASQMVTTPL